MLGLFHHFGARPDRRDLISLCTLSRRAIFPFPPFLSGQRRTSVSEMYPVCSRFPSTRLCTSCHPMNRSGVSSCTCSYRISPNDFALAFCIARTSLRVGDSLPHCGLLSVVSLLRSVPSPALTWIGPQIFETEFRSLGSHESQIPPYIPTVSLFLGIRLSFDIFHACEGRTSFLLFSVGMICGPSVLRIPLLLLVSFFRHRRVLAMIGYRAGGFLCAFFFYPCPPAVPLSRMMVLRICINQLFDTSMVIFLPLSAFIYPFGFAS